MGIQDLLKQLIWNFTVEMMVKVEKEHPGVNIRETVFNHQKEFFSKVMIVEKIQDQPQPTKESFFKDPENPTNEEINKYLETYGSKDK